jgi:2-keto-4-pentenoate hydratase
MDSMTGQREEELKSAANALMDARRTKTAIVDLSDAQRPTDLAEAYAVQDKLAATYGEIGGWKIGAPTPEATPIFAPMPKAWIAAAGSTLTGLAYRGLEAEIAFLVGKDLPPRAEPYTREEALAAMASCHPAIEVLETALRDPGTAPRLTMLADLQLHGAFVFGPAFEDWENCDFNQEMVTLAVDGVLRVERTGSNTSGDLAKLVPWLANEGAVRTGGLKKGQWITTGSWTGNTLANATSVVEVVFGSAGKVGLQFA